MKIPKVSVIMSVYNGNADYFRMAINSILNQTFSDFEFIIINDGSTDPKIEKTIKSYVDKRIKYFYKPNGGIGDSLNYGLDRSNGEYIARMDADDISLPHRFVMQVKFLDENPDVSLVGAGIKMFGDKERVIMYPERPKCLDVLKRNPFAHPVVMMRRADIEKHGFRYRTDYLAAEDYDLWSRMIRVLKMVNLQTVLLSYRWSGQNISVYRAEQSSQEAKEIKDDMLKFLTEDVNLWPRVQNILVSKEPPIRSWIVIPFIKVTTRHDKKIWRLFGIIPLMSARF